MCRSGAIFGLVFFCGGRGIALSVSYCKIIIAHYNRCLSKDLKVQNIILIDVESNGKEIKRVNLCGLHYFVSKAFTISLFFPSFTTVKPNSPQSRKGLIWMAVTSRFKHYNNIMVEKHVCMCTHKLSVSATILTDANCKLLFLKPPQTGTQNFCPCTVC